MRSLLFLSLLASTSAFTAPKLPFAETKACFARRSTSCRSSPSQGTGDGDSNFLTSMVDDVATRARIARESSASGSGFKQVLADVLAGDYESDAVNAELDDLIDSAPCVMFTWEKSPSCRKAVGAMELVGASVKIVRLDDPWEEGNPLRAELGKRTGRTSVPSIWIGGEYVGGYDGGGDDEKSPGIVDLAFRGELRPKLEAAGALKAKG